MFRKICLHHQAIKSIYLFSYNGSTLLITWNLMKCFYDKSDFPSYINTNRYHMISLLNRYNLIDMKEEKNLFPIRNYFYFTEIHPNSILFLNENPYNTIIQKRYKSIQ